MIYSTLQNKEIAPQKREVICPSSPIWWLGVKEITVIPEIAMTMWSSIGDLKLFPKGGWGSLGRTRSMWREHKLTELTSLDLVATTA